MPSTCPCGSSNLRPCPLHATGCPTYPENPRLIQFYGEFSKDVDRLIKLAAQEGAELHAAKYGLESSKQIRSVLANKIRTNWAMALARGNADVILSNLRFVRGGAADEDRYGQFSDQHSRWNKKCEEHRYAYEEFRGRRNELVRMDATRIELVQKDAHGREKH